MKILKKDFTMQKIIIFKKENHLKETTKSFKISELYDN
jgi:hypothetical protein